MDQQQLLVIAAQMRLDQQTISVASLKRRSQNRFPLPLVLEVASKAKLWSEQECIQLVGLHGSSPQPAPTSTKASLDENIEIRLQRLESIVENQQQLIEALQQQLRENDKTN